MKGSGDSHGTAVVSDISKRQQLHSVRRQTLLPGINISVCLPTYLAVSPIYEAMLTSSAGLLGQFSSPPVLTDPGSLQHHMKPVPEAGKG